jgi:hypothetical protein
MVLLPSRPKKTGTDGNKFGANRRHGCDIASRYILWDRERFLHCSTQNDKGFKEGSELFAYTSLIRRVPSKEITDHVQNRQNNKDEKTLSAQIFVGK